MEKNRAQRVCKICYIVILALTFLLACFYVGLVLQSGQDPDGKYVAYIFESSGGATSGFMYHISVLPADEPPPKRGPGNVFQGESDCRDFDIEWLSDDELHVDNFPSASIVLQKESIYGIKITYRFMND